MLVTMLSIGYGAPKILGHQHTPPPALHVKRMSILKGCSTEQTSRRLLRLGACSGVTSSSLSVTWRGNWK